MRHTRHTDTRSDRHRQQPLNRPHNENRRSERYNKQYSNRGRGDSYSLMGYENDRFDNGYEASRHENYGGNEQWDEFEDQAPRPYYRNSNEAERFDDYGSSRNEFNNYEREGIGYEADRYSAPTEGYRSSRNEFNTYDLQDMDRYYDDQDNRFYEDQNDNLGAGYYQQGGRLSETNTGRQRGYGRSQEGRGRGQQHYASSYPQERRQREPYGQSPRGRKRISNQERYWD